MYKFRWSTLGVYSLDSKAWSTTSSTTVCLTLSPQYSRWFLTIRSTTETVNKKTTAPIGNTTVLVLNTHYEEYASLVDANGRFDTDLVIEFGEGTEVYDSCSVTYRNKVPFVLCLISISVLDILSWIHNRDESFTFLADRITHDKLVKLQSASWRESERSTLTTILEIASVLPIGKYTYVLVMMILKNADPLSIRWEFSQKL